MLAAEAHDEHHHMQGLEAGRYVMYNAYISGPTKTSLRGRQQGVPETGAVQITTVGVSAKLGSMSCVWCCGMP